MVALARTSDPTTSHLAAGSVGATDLEAVVLEAVRKFPDGATLDDVMSILNDMSVVTVSPRFRPLLEKGFIVDTGKKRRGKAGRNQRVVKVIEGK